MGEFERPILDWMQRHMRRHWLDRIMLVVSRIGDNGEVWFVTMCTLLVQRSTRQVGWALFWTMCIEVLCCNIILKPTLGRLRPFANNPTIELILKAPTDCSFPSGHTASAFAATTSLWVCGSGMWIPAMVIAVLTAISRLYLYVHWPSDVLGGLGLGTLIGFAGPQLYSFLF